MASTGGALFNTPQVYGNGVVVLVGSVVFGAAGAVSTTKGKGFTVTKAGTGQYTITTTANFNACLSAQIEFNAASGTPESLQPQRGAFANNNALTVYTVSGSTPTNSAQPGNGFDFVLVMSTSSLDS